jgi:hypothetical protein
MPQMETGGPSVGQTVKESAIVQIAARRPSKASLNRGLHAASANIITKSSACWACPMPQTGTGGTIRRTNGEGIDHRKIAARRASKASRNPCYRSGPSSLWLTRRHRRRSSSAPCGSCEQIGSARLWPSVAVPTETSAIGAATASFKPACGHDGKPDLVAE